jgi:hypothetical protein
MAQRVAELCVLEALLDLRALAVEVLDLSSRWRECRSRRSSPQVESSCPSSTICSCSGGTSCVAAPSAGRSELGGGGRDAAHDQPQRLVLPPVRGKLELGDLRAAHLDRVLPGVLGDLGQPGPHRRGAGRRQREPHPSLVQTVHQLDGVEADVVADGDPPALWRQRPGGAPSIRNDCDALIFAWYPPLDSPDVARPRCAHVTT